MLLAAAALVFELSRESLTGTHYRYREYVNGLPTENYVVTSSSLPVAEARRLVDSKTRRLVDGRIVHRKIIYASPLEPYAHDYDALTGTLLRRIPLFFHAKPARVFDPNPVVTLNDPALQDLNDAASAVPVTAYRDVQLDGQALHGPHVTLIDRQPRNVAPPEGALTFDREQDGFEDVNAYFHIDRSQRHLQALGYTGPRAVVPYAIEVDAHAASGADNSFFLPSTTEAGKGVLYFGEGGTDDAEDADILVHEYAHAIMEWIAPGTFGGAFSGEPRAIGEGFGDYWAFSAHVEARRASGRDPYCFADWDARCWQDAASESCGYAPGTDCLRRVDSTKTMADYETAETSGVEHRNGAIWASALREIHEQAGRTVTDTIVVESFFDAPPRPTFAVMAERLLQADRLLYGGAHAGAICSAMFARGIVAQCDTTPRGEWTLFPANLYGVAIPENSPAGVTSTIVIDDPRAIQALSVRVDIDHPARGDLFVELTAPDGTKFVLHQLSSSRTADIHATFPVDALAGRSAAGTWTLFVADRRPRDAGTLQSWGLEIRFAGDEPLTERPRGESQMIPVVAHLFGQDGAYVSDVRIANPSSAPAEATLIFTRSGEDGTQSFAVQRLALAAGQTAALDDVVQRTFHTFGSGTLEVQGEVIAMSRIAGQQVPPGLDTTSLGQPPLLVAPFPVAGRVNFGLAETAGGRGVVRVRGVDVEIAPFSHVQFPAEIALHVVSVVEGDARVTAYLSHIGTDALFIAAEAAIPHTGCVPAITSQTTPEWRSDFWLASHDRGVLRIESHPGGAVESSFPASFEDVLARLFHRTVTTSTLCAAVPASVFASSRIVHGSTTQAVPFLDAGPAEQHLLFIENSAARRTNIGIVSTGATAEVTVYDAEGTEVERFPVTTQRAVQTPLANGRAVVRFLTGTGRAYASVIDTHTGDATFFPGQ
jgi:subtilisin-like proprotein convertase family protein